MGKIVITAEDRKRYAVARALGRAEAKDPSGVVAAAYDRTSDAFRLVFRGGGSMMIPRPFVPGLERQPVSILTNVTVLPPGDALRWPEVDADVYIPGLIERAFGQRLFAAASGQRGGQSRSKAKAAAARRNGAKGGRPRKLSSTR